MNYTGDKLLNKAPMSQALRLTINKWDLKELESFCKERDTVNRTKWKPTDCERIFSNLMCYRGIVKGSSVTLRFTEA